MLLTVLMVAGTMMALQQTLIVPLLPEFPAILGESYDDISWLVTITLLASCITGPIATRMADMYGKRLMMLICIAFSVAGSLIAVLDASLLLLLIGRAMQGVSMAVIPIGISVLRENVPANKVASSIALMSATMGIGGSLGLPLSGLLYLWFGWRSVFLLCAVVGAVLLILIATLFSESRIRSGGMFDIIGAVYLAIALASLLLVISKGSAWGWTSWPVAGLSVTTVVFGAVWFVSQRRHPNPLVDLRTSSRRPVMLTNLFSLCAGFAMFMNMLLITQQYQLPVATGFGFGLNTLTAGLFMIPSGIMMAALSPLCGRLINRFGARAVLILGAAFMLSGYTSLLFWHSSILSLVVGSILLGSGTAFSYAAQPTMIMASVPETDIAAANGINSLVRSIGTALASALVAGLLATLVTTTSGITHPSWEGFSIAYIFAIVASVLAIVFATAIPRASDTTRIVAPRMR